MNSANALPIGIVLGLLVWWALSMIERASHKLVVVWHVTWPWLLLFAAIGLACYAANMKFHTINEREKDDKWRR